MLNYKLFLEQDDPKKYNELKQKIATENKRLLKPTTTLHIEKNEKKYILDSYSDFKNFDVNISDDEVVLLAATIAGEVSSKTNALSKNYNYETEVYSILNVILNRAIKKDISIKKVIFEKKQFSCWNPIYGLTSDNAKSTNKMSVDSVVEKYRKSFKIFNISSPIANKTNSWDYIIYLINEIRETNKIPNIVKNSTMYYSKSIKPNWVNTKRINEMSKKKAIANNSKRYWHSYWKEIARTHLHIFGVAWGKMINVDAS